MSGRREVGRRILAKSQSTIFKTGLTTRELLAGTLVAFRASERIIMRINMKIMQSKMLAVMGMLTLARLSASAAIETQVISYGSAASPVMGGTVDLSYLQFDPSLGQLDGINIILDSFDVAQPLVFSINGAGVAYSGVSVSGGAETVSALGLSTSTTTLAAGPFAGTTTGFFTIAGTGATQPLTASKTVLSADFSSFIGVGSGAFAVSVVPGMGQYSGSGPASVVGFGGVLSSYGTVEIDYNYVAVPEASNFSAFAGGVAGFAALGGLVRQIRRSVV
jgi:hypothetical protein